MEPIVSRRSLGRPRQRRRLARSLARSGQRREFDAPEGPKLSPSHPRQAGGLLRGLYRASRARRTPPLHTGPQGASPQRTLSDKAPGDRRGRPRTRMSAPPPGPPAALPGAVTAERGGARAKGRAAPRVSESGAHFAPLVPSANGHRVAASQSRALLTWLAGV